MAAQGGSWRPMAAQGVPKRVKAAQGRCQRGLKRLKAGHGVPKRVKAVQARLVMVAQGGSLGRENWIRSVQIDSNSVSSFSSATETSDRSSVVRPPPDAWLVSTASSRPPHPPCDLAFSKGAPVKENRAEGKTGFAGEFPIPAKLWSLTGVDSFISSSLTSLKGSMFSGHGRRQARIEGLEFWSLEGTMFGVAATMIVIVVVVSILNVYIMNWSL
ncbi:hypothetical protein ACLB2K_009711 [Fragaria x ananassa]